VPSFGEWGFVLASRRSFDVPAQAPADSRFLDSATMASLFQLSPDMRALPVEENRLNTEVLVRYYEDDWRKLN
jgi:spermidine synthase